MRLTEQQLNIIRLTAKHSFVDDAQVVLFGSRLDDHQKGGDIDLLLIFDKPVEHPALLAAQFSAKISRQMHACKIDVLLSAPNLTRLPIHDIAFQEGIKL